MCVCVRERERERERERVYTHTQRHALQLGDGCDARCRVEEGFKCELLQGCAVSSCHDTRIQGCWPPQVLMRRRIHVK